MRIEKDEKIETRNERFTAFSVSRKNSKEPKIGFIKGKERKESKMKGMSWRHFRPSLFPGKNSSRLIQDNCQILSLFPILT